MTQVQAHRLQRGRQAGAAWPVTLALTGAVLFVASAWLTWAELRPFALLTTSAADQVRLFSEGQVPLPVSQKSQESIAERCYSVSGELFARLQPSDRRKALLSGCLTLIAEITAAAPTVGLAPAVAAVFYAELGDNDAFNAALLHSQRVEPNEQWLAQFRVGVVEDNFSRASPALIEAERHDIEVLALSQEGISSIAQRYVDRPDFRERVTAIVETMPQDSQQRFLNWVKIAVSRLGASNGGN